MKQSINPNLAWLKNATKLANGTAFLELLSAKFFPRINELQAIMHSLQEIDSSSVHTQALGIIVNKTIEQTCYWVSLIA